MGNKQLPPHPSRCLLLIPAKLTKCSAKQSNFNKEILHFDRLISHNSHNCQLMSRVGQWRGVDVGVGMDVARNERIFIFQHFSKKFTN